METEIVKRKRRRRLKSARLALAALALMIALAVTLVNSAVRRPLIAAARERASELAARALNTAVLRVLSREDAPMPELTRQVMGDNLIITADTARLDILTASILREAQDEIASLGREGASVDLGSATGFVPLNGGGPELRIGFAPMGSVTSEISARLASSGINQSLFTVELTLSAHIRMLVAGSEEELEAVSSVPILSTVIVGRVPQVYTNVANEDDMLNLVPTDLP